MNEEDEVDGAGEVTRSWGYNMAVDKGSCQDNKEGNGSVRPGS